MADLIDNPVINSPFEEPQRHFRFAENGITDEIVPGRRRSTYFVPIAQPKFKGAQKQAALDLNVQHRAEENQLINDLRGRVAHWRRAGRPYTTAMTRRLLEYWTRPDRERRLFFCQIEAVETLVYLTEIAPRHDANHGTYLLERLRQANAQATPDGHPALPRHAAKMATGSGKTVVMGMLLAWQALNKLANRQDQRFSDAFLIVAPGITIRDRLRVLLPSDPNNYYRFLDLLPPSLREELGKAKVAIINYHAFLRRERDSAASLTKKLLRSEGEASPFQETEGQMVARVCADLGHKKNLIVLNDEAHHCYHRKPLDVEEKLSGDELQEAKQREEEAKIWVGGLGAVRKKLGIRAVYDLSATPFFLRGSGYDEGTLFPWVTSDFSLTDAIESGIVKVPRVPVADNTDPNENPTYRHLWAHIGKDMPKGRASKSEGPTEPVLPKELQGALHSLYSHYEKAYQQWQAQVTDYPALMPPVFIVVCNNTRSSKLVFDYLAGWEKPLPAPDPATGQRTVRVPGALPIFSNVEDGRWTTRPNTLLIDSRQLESGEALSEEFKAAAAPEIEEFKAELRQRYPGRDVDQLTAEDLLREVMNTVGKLGKLGENIKCVVSVSMLTEGWDCLDLETEILMADGWRGYRQISPGDAVYSFNRQTERIELVPVLEYGERPVRQDEQMVLIESQHLNIRVTEGHEFHIKYRNPRNCGTLADHTIVKTARQLRSRRSSYALPLAAETADRFPGIPLSDDEIRLIAWFITDGGFSGYHLAISQSKEYHNEIRTLLERIGLDYTEQVIEPRAGSYQNAKPCYRFSIPKGTDVGTKARNGWYKYHEYLDKNVSPLLHRMTRSQFVIFWEELLKGDGEKQGNKSGWLWCSEKTQVDGYTKMAILRGFSASYNERVTQNGKTVYRVGIRDTCWITSDPNDERASKIVLEKPRDNEVVWCIRNQNSTIITRRQGKIAIIGNCNTTTHILGVRAFTTQLLCEQVVGRALRRVSHELERHTVLVDGRVVEFEAFPVEYAEVYGVPFEFIPTAGVAKPRPQRNTTHVATVEARADARITFPRLSGYRYERGGEALRAEFAPACRLTLTTRQIPTVVENAPIVGETNIHRLDDLKQRRLNEVAFLLAKLVLEKYFRQDAAEYVIGAAVQNEVKAWLLPQVLAIAKQWLAECLELKDETFPQLLLLIELAHDAADRIYQAIVAADGGASTLKPILQPYNTVGDTDGVSFNTSRATWQTNHKCPISHVVLDSGWEGKMAQALEYLDEVYSYVKNHNLDFRIPYTFEGQEHHYLPDFIVRVDDGRGQADLLNLIVEVSGPPLPAKAAKTATVQNLWVPAVNHSGQFGRWAFVEVKDPDSAMQAVREFLIKR